MKKQNSITPPLEMTELSSQAQKVLDAWDDEWRKGSLCHNQRSIAAALRAAADQIENLYCDGDVEDSPGIVFALRQLMLIADELEGIKYGTYRCELPSH